MMAATSTAAMRLLGGGTRIALAPPARRWGTGRPEHAIRLVLIATTDRDLPLPCRLLRLPAERRRRAAPPLLRVASPVAPVLPAAPLMNQHLEPSGQPGCGVYGEALCGRPEPMGAIIDPDTVGGWWWGGVCGVVCSSGGHGVCSVKTVGRQPPCCAKVTD